MTGVRSLESGFTAVILDGTATPLFWVAGTLEREVLTRGAKLEERKRLPLRTLRCVNCSNMEWQAGDLDREAGLVDPAALLCRLTPLDRLEELQVALTTPRPFTSRTRVALAIARGIAGARGDTDLSSTHIALGILREGANAAIAALWYAGLTEADMNTLRVELEQALGDPPGWIPPRQVTIDLTPGEAEVIRLADVEADRLGDPYLGAEHILLALLRFDEAVVRLVASRGVTLAQYEAGLASVRRGDPPPTEPRAV